MTRSIRTSTSLGVALAAGLAGCSWGAFDDLANETWVDSAGPADGISPNVFLGVAAPGMPNGNAVFVVLGQATDSVGSYRYDADGVRATTGAAIRAGSTQFGGLSGDTPIAGDPYSHIVGVAGVTNTDGNGNTKIVHFRAHDVTIEAQSDFHAGFGPLFASIQPTGLAYGKTDAAGDPSATDAILARGNQVAIAANYANGGGALAACIAETMSHVVKSVAAGRFVADGDDEILMVVNDAQGTLPQIVIFDGRVITEAYGPNPVGNVQNCFDGSTRVPLARIDGPAGDAEFGRHVALGDFDGDGRLDWAVTSPGRNAVTAYVNDGDLSDGTTSMQVQPPFEASRFGHAIAAGDLDGDGADELIVGAPYADVRGTTNGGTAHVYRWSGSGFELALTLHDAQPEVEQRFGSSVAVVRWGADRHVLVVGTETEVFTYFRTALYDDVRTGR